MNKKQILENWEAKKEYTKLMAMEFALWLQEDNYVYVSSTNMWTNGYKHSTTEELYNLFSI